MATTRPRMAITLPAETIAVLAKLSALQKRPRSAIAADLLVEMTPALANITKLLEVAIRNRESLPKNTAARLQSLEEMLGSVAHFGVDQLGELVHKPEPTPAPTRGSSVARRRRGH